MMKESRSSSWPDLRPELLGLILRRLAVLADRIRLRAVCRPWRSNARLEPLPPPLPWLTLLDGTFLSIPDGNIISIPTPGDAFCSGSVDNWMFFVHSDGRFSLMNPFSKASLNIPKLAIEWFDANSRYDSRFYKLVVPSPLESLPGPLVALMSKNGDRVRICQPPIAAEARRACKTRFRLVPKKLFPLSDIAFFNGKLYGLSRISKAFSLFEINYNLNNKPKMSYIECITSCPLVRLIWPQPLPKSCMVLRYLVECCGRLLMVKRMVERREIVLIPWTLTALWRLRSFEADLSTKPGQWRCVSELGGQVLFVGKHCSKSLPAGECTGIQGDCIYFMCDYHPANFAVDPLCDSGVYNMKYGIVTVPLLSETAVVPQNHGGQWRPTWIFPADTM